MADVFGIALATGGELLRDAAIDAGYELGLFEQPVVAPSRRMRALIDYLVALGALTPDGKRGDVPPRPQVPRAGWGLMADVIRRDKPLSVEGGEVELRYHEHLAKVGAPAAAELAALLVGTLVAPEKMGQTHFPTTSSSLSGDEKGDGPLFPDRTSHTSRLSIVDLGAGAGTYAAAVLDAAGHAGVDVHATVVDYPEVIALARGAMARFGNRVRFVAHDIRGANVAHDVRSADIGDDICGDDIRGDDIRGDDIRGDDIRGDDIRGNGEGTHDLALLANVLHLHPPETCAQLVAIAARAVKPGGAVVIKDLRVDEGRTGPFEGLAFALNMAVYTGGGDVYETSQLRVWLEQAGLVAIEEKRLASQPDGIVMIGYRPRTARQVFEMIAGPATPSTDAAMPSAFRTMLAHAPEYREHYAQAMPALREEYARDTRLFHVPLDWSRLPRLRTIVERLERLANVRIERARTIGELYERTHYGGFMPLLYGYPAHVAYFEKRSRELGLDDHGTIDRYLAAPILHELCHFDRERDALLPPHLDECIAGFIGVHVWPEMAYPDVAHDDALFAAPWLSQVGQAFARAFGLHELMRAHVGQVPWEAVMPPRMLERITRFGWEDWQARRTQHFLSDTLLPEPWIAIVRDVIAARPDPDFDRQVFRDGLRAMCLASTSVEGSMRVRSVVPDEPIVIDAKAGWMRTSTMRYWLPPSVTRDREVRLRALDEIDSEPL